MTADATLAHMGKGLADDAATKNRVVRVTDEVWDKAKAKAADNGETVSDVIRRALVAYAGLPKRTTAMTHGRGGDRDRTGDEPDTSAD